MQRFTVWAVRCILTTALPSSKRHGGGTADADSVRQSSECNVLTGRC